MLLTRQNQLISRLTESRESLNVSRRGFSVEIGGACIELLTGSEALFKQIKAFYDPYASPSERVPSARLIIEPCVEPGLWENSDPEFDVRGEFVIQRDFAARRIEPRLALAFVPIGLDDAIHNLLRWFLPAVLLDHRAFLLHGAGVITQGRGYVFFGQSGAGKSTTLSLILRADPTVIPLGDDAVIIGMQGNVPTLFSAPVGAGYVRSAPPNFSVPLRGLFNLKQSDEDRIEKLSPSQGVAALLASAMSVDFGSIAPLGVDLALLFSGSATGIDRLHFRPLTHFWNKVTQEIRQ